MISTAVATVFIFVFCTTLSQTLDIQYDVTTLVKFITDKPSPYSKTYESPIVVARGNARGLPLRQRFSYLHATHAGQRCCQSWTREGWTKLDIVAAFNSNPPLDPDLTPSFDGTPDADRTDRFATIIPPNKAKYEGDSQIGDLPVDGRIRLSFRLSSETSTLGLYLCDKQEASGIECVTFLLSGYDSTRSFLRYRALHLSNSSTGPPIDTPFGKLKSTLLHKNETAPQTWAANTTYNFLVERSYEGNFEVRLDGADFQQKRLMTVKATPKMSTFAAFATPSDSSTVLNVKPDPTWYGYLRPGGYISVDFQVPEKQEGQLGVFLCADRFQEECIGEVISGYSAKGVRYVIGKYDQKEKSDPKYWVAGTEERTYRSTELERSGYLQVRWDKIITEYKERENEHGFSLARYSNGSVIVAHDRLGKDKRQFLNAPKEYVHIFIASYHHEGDIFARASDNGKCIGITACIAPAPVWELRAATGELRSPSLPATVAKVRTCVRIVARISPGSRVSVTMQRTGGLERIEMGVLSIASQGKTQWLTRRFVKGTPAALRDKPLDILVSVTQPLRNPDPVLVQWVSNCNADADEDVYEQHLSEVFDSGYEIGYNVLIKPPKTEPNPVCMNGGHLNMVTNKCVCAPGFSGGVCDRGCGADFFGADCLGKCSRLLSGRDCRGVRLCAPGLKCDCAPGFGGTKCTEECEPGRYGIGCREVCGDCRYGVPCNPYTGRCEDGCRGALQPPYCKEECGRSIAVVPYITNGADAKADDFPWHAGVYELKPPKRGKPTDSETFEQVCGASLVKPKILISAAHCFYSENDENLKPTDKFQVALGKTYRAWDDENGKENESSANPIFTENATESQGSLASVARFEKPPDRVQRRDVYWIHIPTRFKGDLGAYADDIALVELFDPVLNTPYVSPVCLDWTGGYDAVLDSAMTGSVVGWGKTENGDNSRELKIATLPYIGSEECLSRIRDRAFLKYINKDKFCAGNRNGKIIVATHAVRYTGSISFETKLKLWGVMSLEGSAVSTGDSGGGFVFKNHEQEGAWFLRGIVSVGPRTDRTYAVYTNASSYRQWLTHLRDQVEIRGAAIAAALDFGE